MIRAYGMTDIGKVRKVNEDSYCIILPATYVIADGMGGHVAGEVASRILVDTAQQLLPKSSQIGERELQTVILAANAAILQRIEQEPALEGMGTTATLLHCQGNQVTWAHVGDSRIYLLRSGKLLQMTKDHSLVSDLVDHGTITREEAKTHPRKNVLMRAVGVDENVLVDCGHFILEDQDILLLCTDGLTNMVQEADILSVLETGELEDRAATLIQKALDAGGMDNITAIVARYDAQ